MKPSTIVGSPTTRSSHHSTSWAWYSITRKLFIAAQTCAAATLGARAASVAHPGHFLRADAAVERLEPPPPRARVVRHIDRVRVRRVEVELDGGETLGDHLAGAFGVVGRVGRVAGVAIGI